MKHVYNYDTETFEFTGEEMADLDPAESELKGRNIFLLPANATFVEPPVEVDNKIQVFNVRTQKWAQRSDFRGSTHFTPTGERKVIVDIGRKIPKINTMKEPPEFKDPKWDGKVWKEGALLFRDKRILDKARVDELISKDIAALGEEKIKTAYLISLTEGGPCLEWEAFLEARKVLLDEGNAFVADNNLV
jgi:hypothetical protein